MSFKVGDLMKEQKDKFLWTKEYKIITKDHHHVPGLANFAHWNFKSASTVAEPHYHTNIFEFHCMMSGRRIFNVQIDGSNSTFVVTGNHVAITFPGESHGYNDDFAEPYEFYGLQIDVSDPEHMLGLDRDYSLELYHELLELQEKMQKKHNRLLVTDATHNRMLVTAFNLFSTFNDNSIKSGVQFINCFLFGLKYLQFSTKQGTVDKNISASVSYIHQHYLESPSLQELADHAGYSLSYFKTKFKEVIGITPADYITIQKIDHAKKLLVQSNASITSISTQLNFSSVSYFCTVFKKITSYTPMAYRDKNSSHIDISG